MSVGSGGNQDVYDSRSWLGRRGHYSRRELAVAGGDVVVDGQCVERALECRESPKTLGADGSVSGDQHAEVQLGERGGADRKFSLQWLHVSSDQ